MINTEDVYKIGYLAKTHGLTGEMILVGECCEMNYFIIETEGILVPFFVKSFRPRRNDSALVMFDGINSVERAQDFVGCSVFLERKNVEQQPATMDDAEELPLSYFIGFTVVTNEISERSERTPQTELGVIDYIDDATENCLFVLDDGTMIPVQEEFIEWIDHKNKRLVVSLPDGLLDL